MPLVEGRPPQPSFEDTTLLSKKEQEREVSMEDLATIGLLSTMKLVPGFKFTVDDIITSADRIRAGLESTFPQTTNEDIDDNKE